MKNWLRSNEKKIYRVVNAGVLTGLVILGGGHFLGTGVLGRMHLLTALAVLGVFAGLNFMAARGRILCLSVLSVLLFTVVAAVGAERSFAFLEAFFPWLVRGEAPEEWRLGYSLVQTGFLAGICYFIQVLYEKIPVLKTVFGVLTFLVMGICLLTRRELDHYGVTFQLCFCVIVWTEWIQSRWKKRRSSRSTREAHTLWIMPFLALYLALMAVMPAPEKPYDWMWAKNIYQQIRETFLTYTRNMKWGSREGFGMSFSGFSGDGELGGDLEKESGLVMKIKVGQEGGRNAFGSSSGNFGGNLYLTGRVYDTFDGRGWYQNWQGYQGEVFLDTAETLYAVKSYNEKYERDYLREVSLEICYEDFNTGYAFAPLKTWSLKEGEAGAEPDYVSEGGSLRWKEQKGYGTEYRLQYFRMNLGQQVFDRFLEEAGESRRDTEEDKTVVDKSGIIQGSEEGREKSETGENDEAWGREENRQNIEDPENGEKRESEQDIETLNGQRDKEIWTEVQRECKRRNGEEFTREDLNLYRKEIYENYMGEINLSLDMQYYLEEITEEAETDVEKLRAIERALQALSYTLTPGELPEWVEEEGEFLDYFILESRQGYCTYFATAFVLLARAEGIPARYVQGYSIPVPEDGEVLVDSSMAHAWPEAYLDGVGWIPFEPTPGYAERRYWAWDAEQPEEGDQTGEEGSLGPDSQWAGEQDGTEKGVWKEESGEIPSEDEQGGEDAEPEEENSFPVWKLLGTAIPMLLAVCAVLLALDNALSRYRYRKMPLRERFRKEVFRNLEILNWFGLRRKEWETLQELQERARHLPGLNSIALCFMENYERVIYGGEEISNAMLEGTVKEREEILSLLKNEKKWVYFYCRLGLLFGKYR